MRSIESLTAPASFDAVAYVESIWPSRVTSSLEVDAVPVSQVTSSGGSVGGAARSVTAAGVITSVETTSRAGVATIDLDPVDGRPDALLQVGPVIRGTALRDALSFIRFTDFTNQIEFAAVAGALNDRVLSDVLGHVDLAALAGQRVRILGAAVPGAASGDLPVVVAVTLGVEGPP